MAGPLPAWLLAVALVSLAACAAPMLLRLSHRAMQFVLSGVSGAMLGVACFHMLPEAVEGAAEEPGRVEAAMVALVVGYLSMFLLERFACYHHHGEEEVQEAAGEDAACCGHSHSTHHLSWLGAFVGLSVHALAEGVAIAAGVRSAAGEPLAGIGIFLVVLLHKPFDGVTLGLLLRRAGWAASSGRALAVNALYAVMPAIGATLILLGASGTTDIMPLAMAFAAGTFLCIASSDLLPELQFHRHDRMALSACLIAGLLAGWGLSKVGGHDGHDGHQHHESRHP